ncbi:glycosyltransferase family 2 protein [Butyrivibrio sp. INlla14]|uniref:glycosyltransferase family 2 protein n=1 Tax=Butyrivibrio sp. INlla14 TaxID=1520808 RepID=UPI0008772BE8|nr:glycosyltransferase family A protein [Butyrivibrio sp. INlla14]SCY70321.1 hypothetical protein SAMN02910371_03477 [Butyrivibrio sp. INlla14]
MILTIVTPTYNRAEKIKKLYMSLCAQTNKEFEWLIIDDGSTDETGEVVRGFLETAGFRIRYEYQENGGKHRALNKGIALIDSELTFIVDSDDWLTENAVETIFEFEAKYAEKKATDKLCGFSFLRAYSNGEVNTGKYHLDEVVDTFRQQRINNNLLGDKAEVYYTDVLKKYPFEEFDGEKFMPEDAVWLKMSGPYNMVHANRVIYYCDYLEGGLTKSGKRMKIHSPYGMMYRSAVYLNDTEVNIKTKIKMAILYDVYLCFARNKRQREDSDFNRCVVHTVIGNILIWVVYLPAFIIYKVWQGRYE